MSGISSRAPGPPNQSIIACQPVHHYTSNQPRASFGMGGQQGPLHPQRLSMQSGAPHHRISPPHYPMSLHNALTGVSGPPKYTQATIPHRTGTIQQRPSPPPPSGHIRQIQYQQQQQQHQQQQNAIHSSNIPNSARVPTMPLSSTIGMNQQVINQMNAERELNNPFQQRLQTHQINPIHQSMPRLHQIPQQRIFQQHHNQQQQQQQYQQQQYQQNINNRVGQLAQKRPAAQGLGSSIEISEVRPNKEPRVVVDNQLLIQRQVRPAEIRPTQVNHNVAAAIGSVGSAGVNSVRLGNSITLSVCPTNSTHNSPATSPALQDLGLKQSSRSSSPAQAHHSVLAVRGVTVTPASPPITGISPVSSPSPSHSPVASSLTQHQIQQQQKAQASVIQRGPTSMSPPRENPPRDDNFSPPVISTVRGNVQPATTQSIPLQQAAASHNFAIPRPPPPIHRMQYSSSSYGMGVTVNSTAQRPDRPPTVDLTDDDVQTHAQQRISGVPQNHQMMNPPPIRRFVAAQAATFPQQRSSTTMDRLPSCNICGLMFPSIVRTFMIFFLFIMK